MCVCVCYKTETGKLAQRPHMQIGYVIILSKQLRPQSAKLASLVTQMVKNLPAMWETQVRSLGWEDPQEKGIGTHSSILSWRIPWSEEPGRL